jgi:predicted RNase H-like HicB family nuclease
MAEAVAGIKRWNQGLDGSFGVQHRLSSFQHWYYDPECEQVAPSKFIGYPGLSNHQEYLDRARGELWGGITERALKKWFEELSPQSREHAFIRSKVDDQLRKHGKWIRSGARMHAPRGWRLEPGAESRENPEVSPSGLPRPVSRALQRTIKASVYPDEEGYYVAECLNIAVATQGRTIEETLRNLQEAVSVHLEGEDLEALGLAPDPSILVTMELEPAVA